MAHPILICTVGTSLFRPNLERLKSQLDQGRVEPTYERLAKAYSQSNWPAVAALNEWLQNPNYFRTREEICAERAAKKAAEAWSAWEQAESRLEDLRRRKEEVEKQSEQLRGENEQLRRELDATRAQLVRTENERQDLTEEIAGLRGELEAQRTAAKELAQQIDACRQALAEARTSWWRRLLGRWFAAR